MDLWELSAREAIRDLVVRYNSNADTGRFAEVIVLFASDAVMELPDQVYRGVDEIATIFASTRDRAGADAAPRYLRHWTGTHQIDLIDEHRATGRCYYQVITAVGLDHWGRYIDEYRNVAGVWKFAHRRATVDGTSADSQFQAIV